MSRQSIIAAFSVLICIGNASAGQMLPFWLFPATERGPEPRLVSAPESGKLDGLGRLLLSQGYTAIPLDYLAGVHTAVQVTVGGKQLRLVVDTGSPWTCLDRDRTKDLKLDWNGVPPPKRNKDELFELTMSCSVPELTVGGFSSRNLWAYGYNAALWNDRVSAKDHTDGLLGADVLYPAGAIIDLPGRTLYVKKAVVQRQAVLQLAEDGVYETTLREFCIPLAIDPTWKETIERVGIFVSVDRGKTWKHERDCEPRSGRVIFKAPRDGEYWFAVQVALKEGGASPADLDKLEPAQKVRVRTSVESGKPASKDDAQLRPVDVLKEVELLRRRVEELEFIVRKKK